MDRFPYRDTPGAREKAQSQPLPSLSEVKGGKFDCQRDINCPEGADYQDEKRAVAEGYDGTYICSGQLINNVREDNRYLYITAGHCGWYEDPSTMSYYWNYENTGCGTNDYPDWTYSTGSTDLFHVNSETRDMNLLELHGTDLEGTYNIYFMGWNRGTSVPTGIAVIGHPDDKPKQIALRYSPIIDCAVGDCSGGWGDNFWRVDAYDVGVTEGGSSGSALMDQDHLVVGTLTGGVGSTCKNFTWDEYAKISVEWASLQPHLDPDNTGAVSIPGKNGLSGGEDPPGQASSPRPAHGAVNVSIYTDLDWNAGSQTDTHRVYFGTNPSPGAGEFQGEQSGTGFDPGTLANDTTYYWRIDEVNAYGTTTGNVWSFTTELVSTGDVVTILKAEWKAAKQELVVEATSSEQPNATLTVVGFGTMTYKAAQNKYTLKIKPVANPGTVTVTSSLGGSAAANVVIR
jgi:V8-like Glu-specific endopeptidase